MNGLPVSISILHVVSAFFKWVKIEKVTHMTSHQKWHVFAPSWVDFYKILTGQFDVLFAISVLHLQNKLFSSNMSHSAHHLLVSHNSVDFSLTPPSPRERNDFLPFNRMIGKIRKSWSFNFFSWKIVQGNFTSVLMFFHERLTFLSKN